MLKGGGVGAKRVMMATQGEGLGSGFCSLLFWSLFWFGEEKEIKSSERRRERMGRRGIYSSKAVNITVLFLTSSQSLASSSSVVLGIPSFHKKAFICGVRAVSGRCSQ